MIRKNTTRSSSELNMDFNRFFRITLGLIGIFLSVYSLFVEVQAHSDKNYKALCDINEQISCTKVFLSEYGKGFGLVAPILGKDSMLNLPNPVYGVVFYSLIVLLSMFANTKGGLKLLTCLAAMSFVMSIYLATILYKMKDTCIVCISTYVVNAGLLYLSFKRFNEFNVLEKLKNE